MEKSNLLGSMLSSKPVAEQSTLTSSFSPSHNAPFPISSFTYRKPTCSSLTPSTISGSSGSGLSRFKSSHVTSQSKHQAKVASQQSQYVSLTSSYGAPHQKVYSALVTASGNTFPSQMGYSSHATASYSSNTGYSNQQNVCSESTETSTQGSMLRSKAATKQKVKTAAKQSVKAAGKQSVKATAKQKSSQDSSQYKNLPRVASQQSPYVCSASSYGSQQSAYSPLMTTNGNAYPSQMDSMPSSKAAAEQSALTSSFTPSSLIDPFSYSSYSSQIMTSFSLTPSTVSGYSCSGLFGSASTQGTSQSKYQAQVASQQSQYKCSANSYGSQQLAYSALVTPSGNTYPSQSGYSSHATASYSSNTGYSNQQNVYSRSTETTTQDSMLSSQARVKQCVLPSSYIIFPYSPLTNPTLTSCLAPSTVSGDSSLGELAQVASLQPPYVSSASSYGLQKSAYLASMTTSGNTCLLQTDPCFQKSLDSSEDSQDSFSTELQTIFMKNLAEEESVSDFNQEEDKQTEKSLKDLGDQSVTSKKDEDNHMDFNLEEDRQTEESLNDVGVQSVTPKKDEDKHMEFYQQQMEEGGTSDEVVEIFDMDNHLKGLKAQRIIQGYNAKRDLIERGMPEVIDFYS